MQFTKYKKTVPKSQLALQNLSLAVMHLCSTLVKFSSGSMGALALAMTLKIPSNFVMGAFLF